MDEELQDMLDALGADEWEAGDLGDTITCPHGHTIELDGRCPEGCVSPLLLAGMI